MEWKMKMEKKQNLQANAAIMAAVALILALAAAKEALAVPPIAAEFYGAVHIDGNPAPPGTGIIIYDSNGTICGEQATKKPGEYGLLSCKGDDLATLSDEGARNGETAAIYVNRVWAHNATWKEGILNKAELSISTAPTAATAGTKPPKAVRLESAKLSGALIIMALAAILATATFIYIKKGELS